MPKAVYRSATLIGILADIQSAKSNHAASLQSLSDLHAIDHARFTRDFIGHLNRLLLAGETHDEVVERMFSVLIDFIACKKDDYGFAKGDHSRAQFANSIISHLSKVSNVKEKAIRYHSLMLLQFLQFHRYRAARTLYGIIKNLHKNITLE